MDQKIIMETQAWKALSAFLVKQPACTTEHLARLTAAGVIQALDAAGFEVVPKTQAGCPHIVERTTIAGKATIRTVELVPGRRATETEALKASRWVLAEVVPGPVRVRPSLSGRHDHQVTACATATLVRHGGMGFGERREISVDTTWDADEGAVSDATSNAVALALQQARDAAKGFIEAAEQALAA